MQVTLYADGGSRGNPGTAGSGSVLFDAQGEEIAAIAYVVGEATNNVAEYHGLLKGLEEAVALGATDVRVRMDSKLVVEQMTGRWKIKHPDMQQLATQCQKLAAQFESIEYKWVPRKENARADELSNQAMDALKAGAAIGVVAGVSSSNTKESGEVGVDNAAENTDNTAEKPALKPVLKPAEWNGAQQKPTRFVLLRHGQTAMSAAKQYSGHSDPELSEIGAQQAARVAQYVKHKGGIDAIVASPLRRCQATAQACADALGLTVHTEAGLIELDFGAWDGLTFAEAAADNPELHSQWLQDPKVAPPKGESLQAAFRRVKKVHAELLERYAGKTVLVVSHVTPIKAMLRIALDAPASMFHKVHLDLASISVAEFYADGPTCVRLLNDTSFLR